MAKNRNTPGRAAGNRRSSRQRSSMMAFCGMMVALATVMMFTGGLIPVLTYCAPMIAGVILLPVLLEYGKKAAWTAYAAVALITLFVGIDKEAAFFFLFLGYYPIVKWDIDRIKRKPLRVLLKLLVFNVSIAAMYAILGFLLHMDAMVAEFSQMGAALLAVFVVLMNVCMFMYDKLLTPLVLLYAKRLRPKLRFLRS